MRGLVPWFCTTKNGARSSGRSNRATDASLTPLALLLLPLPIKGMNNITEIALILAILGSVWMVLSRDFTKGLAYAVFWCVWMTTFLRVQTFGAMPELTMHRLV